MDKSRNKKRLKKISLYPLKPERVLSLFVQVKPEGNLTNANKNGENNE
jgi:hypothetical protein